MDSKTVNAATNIGIATNLAAGHVGEMAGRAISSAGQTVGCPVAQTVGKGIESAGKAWSDAAVSLGNRDRARLTNK